MKSDYDGNLLHFGSAIIILRSFCPSSNISCCEIEKQPYEKLTLILSIFILIHTFFLSHSWIFWVYLLAGGVLEPLFTIVVILFGIIYSVMIGGDKPKNKV